MGGQHNRVGNEGNADLAPAKAKAPQPGVRHLYAIHPADHRERPVPARFQRHVPRPRRDGDHDPGKVAAQRADHPGERREGAGGHLRVVEYIPGHDHQLRTEFGYALQRALEHLQDIARPPRPRPRVPQVQVRQVSQPHQGPADPAACSPAPSSVMPESGPGRSPDRSRHQTSVLAGVTLGGPASPAAVAA